MNKISVTVRFVYVYVYIVLWQAGFIWAVPWPSSQYHAVSNTGCLLLLQSVLWTDDCVWQWLICHWSCSETQESMPDWLWMEQLTKSWLRNSVSDIMLLCSNMLFLGEIIVIPVLLTWVRMHCHSFLLFNHNNKSAILVIHLFAYYKDWTLNEIKECTCSNLVLWVVWMRAI